jgi:sigma-B regulation protein RsbU (phosphoserine phosphatase)
VIRILFQSFFVGVITVTTAFFIFERILQKRLVPVLFPQGGLYATPQTIRINIRTRLAALMLACNFIPCVVMVLIGRGAYYSVLPGEQLVNQIRITLFANGIIFLALGVGLTLLVGSNLTRPFEGIIDVLRNILQGNLSQRIAVTTNDEIGYTADVINEMAEGLREREQLRRSLELAREVQQNLLPQAAPVNLGVDVAGTSLYCDQTGGDYYDFIETFEDGVPRLGLVIGDVAGHGISSALLMATTRAFIRLRTSLRGDPAQIITDVNTQLSRDVANSGQFMTLFYLLIDPAQRSVQWVRAGHDPAILFDPHANRIEELRGQGIALGIDEAWQYQAQRKDGLKSGQIIVLGTDGIWESTNSAGEMFGKETLFELIRANATANAQDILDAVVADLTQFQDTRPPEDDITLVVAKL